MIQFISHYNDQYNYLDTIALALQGGCRWVQLRMKNAPIEEVRRAAKLAQVMCQNAGATLIIDDHVELVKELHADGVHLGLNDMPIAEARRLLGDGYIIGGTANTFDDVKAHAEAGADYIGCGPFRFTTTKERLSPVLGLEGYRQITERMRNEHIDLPIVAIGGITAADVPSIMKTGVTGIAISGAVINAVDPVDEMKRLIKIIDNE